jgi:hypothetical protein
MKQFLGKLAAIGHLPLRLRKHHGTIWSRKTGDQDLGEEIGDLLLREVDYTDDLPPD